MINNDKDSINKALKHFNFPKQDSTLVQLLPQRMNSIITRSGALTAGQRLVHDGYVLD